MESGIGAEENHLNHPIAPLYMNKQLFEEGKSSLLDIQPLSHPDMLIPAVNLNPLITSSRG